MDRDALKGSLKEQFEQSLDEALEAVEKAPDGQWIAASEWQVREIFQKLTAQCFEKMLQAKMDAAPQAAFSPSRPHAPQIQGQAPHQRSDRRRPGAPGA